MNGLAEDAATPAHGQNRWSVFAQSAIVAVAAYVAAGATEAALIRLVAPTASELAWISDVVLAAALGVAVYLWRHLQASRQELAARERAELVLHTQLSVAADIQRRLLPDLPSPAAGIGWAASLRPAGAIGGDFYDIIELAPTRWLALVADVSGKGIPAAMALGSLRAAFRTLARDCDDPARVLTLLSGTLSAEWKGQPYLTAIVARLDAPSRTLTYANAGHPPGVVVGGAGVRLLTSSGPPAGLLAEVAYSTNEVRLERGDVCTLVSDGVTEAIDDGRTPPVEQIASLVGRVSGSATAVCDAVMDLALRGTGPAGVADWNDDRTVVVLAVDRGETGASPARNGGGGRPAV